ncbi:MAG: hypothetical protein SFU99_03475 [Saprospiraceae bacterium]|nr:hypothetical protein [Saprospiraceae bacterium]
MNAVLNLGKFLFAIPFAVFGLFHFMNAEAMKGAAFNSSILVYIAGIGLLAASVSMLIGKYDKLASTLLALLLLIFVFAIHLNGAMDGDQNAVGQVLKDTMLAGASLMYAKYVARDKAVIG